MSSTNGHSSFASALMVLHAQSSLHPGAGAALGSVDLPIQRERHTSWPTIPGSSLKGVLRDVCREQYRQTKPQFGGDRKQINSEDDDILLVFGPNQGASDLHSGALSTSDARILAFPVRSVKGVFAWVTSPGVLERLNRDLAMCRRRGLPVLPNVEPDKVACVADSPLLVRDKTSAQIVLEEYEFDHVDVEGIEQVTQWIAHQVSADEATSSRLQKQLVILSDDDFTYFVRHCTEVVARIGLNYETKTVEDGALFYQEFLPPETILYSLVMTTQSRYEKRTENAQGVMQVLATAISSEPMIQIGGDATVGKGFCMVNFINHAEE